eukprot:7497732-Alexandrium_andersonii.AAC.1
MPATAHGLRKVTTFSHRSGGVARASPRGKGRHAASKQTGDLVGAVSCPWRDDGSRSGAVRSCQGLPRGSNNILRGSRSLSGPAPGRPTPAPALKGPGRGMVRSRGSAAGAAGIVPRRGSERALAAAGFGTQPGRARLRGGLLAPGSSRVARHLHCSPRPC